MSVGDDSWSNLGSCGHSLVGLIHLAVMVGVRHPEYRCSEFGLWVLELLSCLLKKEMKKEDEGERRHIC